MIADCPDWSQSARYLYENGGGAENGSFSGHRQRSRRKGHQKCGCRVSPTTSGSSRSTRDRSTWPYTSKSEPICVKPFNSPPARPTACGQTCSDPDLMAAAVLAEPYLKCGQELRAAAVAADDRCRVQHGVPTHLPSEPICPRGAVRGAVRWCSAGAARHALDGRRTE